MNDSITIVVNSCDKYSDLWYPFFELFRIQWPDCPYPIILNTESLCYVHSREVAGGITSLQLFSSNDDGDWSSRLIKTLEHVHSEFTIMFLDDEFILKPVDKVGFLKVFNTIKRDNLISNIIFSPGFTKNDGIASLIYRHFNRVPRTRNQHSANAAIWRTERLRKYLKAGESIWEFELNSVRRRGLFERCYTIKWGESPICTLFMVNEGYGIVEGKWAWKNKELFLMHDISIDFEKRGIYSAEEAKSRLDEYFSRKRDFEQLSLAKKVKLKIELWTDCLPEDLHNVLRNIKHLGS